MSTIAMNPIAMNPIAMNPIAMNPIAMNPIAMNPIAINPISWEVITDPLAEQLRNHVWKHFNYVLTQDDAEEIMFTDRWSSIDEFIEYMQQDTVNPGISQTIPSQTNCQLLPPGCLYSTQQLDAMDAGSLPLDYGLYGQSMIDLNLDTILPREEEDDGYDSNVGSIYDGEPLRRYQSIKLPTYEITPRPLFSPRPLFAPRPLFTPLPLFSHSTVSETFDLNPMVEEPGNLPTHPPLPMVQEAKPKSRKRDMFSKLCPCLTDKIKKLREKIPPLEESA
ncbi:hypothetical protein GQX73_g9433 [Xylaria multiplex]|uniref:Uncharacterized protein n=1 Tax=Xylaria multiplex TaxID=323545 RepID=A0A7C8MS17_9PEZI|nr:hypothetical protein GQX73_g9433 [Xylaria multiplex]